MVIQGFENVIAWQKGKDLFIMLSEEFHTGTDNYFKDQILRAGLSVTNNIAEGFDRGSSKELRQFLIIARGSCAEVRSMLHICKASGRLTDNKYRQLSDLTIEISKLLTGFIKSIDQKAKQSSVNDEPLITIN